jgi:hypothetical protein
LEFPGLGEFSLVHERGDGVFELDVLLRPDDLPDVREPFFSCGGSFHEQADVVGERGLLGCRE